MADWPARGAVPTISTGTGTAEVGLGIHDRRDGRGATCHEPARSRPAATDPRYRWEAVRASARHPLAILPHPQPASVAHTTQFPGRSCASVRHTDASYPGGRREPKDGWARPGQTSLSAASARGRAASSRISPPGIPGRRHEPLRAVPVVVAAHEQGTDNRRHCPGPAGRGSDRIAPTP